MPLLYQRRYGSESSATYYISPDFPLVYAAQCALEAIHTKTQLPWWATIIGTTILLRSAITLPLAIHQNKMIAKMELLQPTLKEISVALKNNLAVKFRRHGRSAEEFNKAFKTEVTFFLYASLCIIQEKLLYKEIQLKQIKIMF